MNNRLEMPFTQVIMIEGNELQLLPQQEARRPRLPRQHAVILDDDIDEDEEVNSTGQMSFDDL